MRMSLGNHITLSPVVGWLCQERWKVAGRNEAVLLNGINPCCVPLPPSCDGKEKLREMGKKV